MSSGYVWKSLVAAAASLVMALGLILTVAPVSGNHDSVCRPSRTGPIADVLYSAGGNSADSPYHPAGVYAGVDQAYIKLIARHDGQLMAHGIVRDGDSGAVLITEGWATAECGDDSVLDTLLVGFRNAKTGETATVEIVPARTGYGQLATLRIPGYELVWNEVVFVPAGGR